MPRGIPNEKRQVIASVPAATNLYETLFIQSIRESLPNLRLYSDEQLMKKLGQDKVTDLALEFFGFIEAGAGKNLTRNELLALAQQSLNCLKKYIEGMQMPVTLKTLCDSIPLLDAAVNVCFPGYVASRLLRYTILPLHVQ